MEINVGECSVFREDTFFRLIQNVFPALPLQQLHLRQLPCPAGLCLSGLECSKPRYVSWEDAVQTDPKKKGKKKKYKNVILKERNRSVVINQDS